MKLYIICIFYLYYGIMKMNNNIEFRIYQVIGADGQGFMGIINKHAIESENVYYKDCNLDCGKCRDFKDGYSLKYDICVNKEIINKFIELNKNTKLYK